MKFARVVFIIAGVYGIVGLAPLYFMESMVVQQTGSGFNHPEYYYGFLGVTLSWQVAFLVIASDPIKYRNLMYAACLEKLSFSVAIPILFLQERVAMSMNYAAGVDFLLLLLFIGAILNTGVESKSGSV